MEEETRSVPVQSIVSGVVVIAVGLLFLFDNLDMLDIGGIGQWWPLILIILGAGKLTGTVDQRYGGAWLIAIGTWLLISSQGYWGLDYSNSWPLIVIFAGLMMITKAFLGHSRRHCRQRTQDSLNGGVS